MPAPTISPEALATFGGVVSAGLVAAVSVAKALDRYLGRKDSSNSDIKRIVHMLDELLHMMQSDSTSRAVAREREAQHHEVTKKILDRIERRDP